MWFANQRVACVHHGTDHCPLHVRAWLPGQCQCNSPCFGPPDCGSSIICGNHGSCATDPAGAPVCSCGGCYSGIECEVLQTCSGHGSCIPVRVGALARAVWGNVGVAGTLTYTPWLPVRASMTSSRANARADTLAACARPPLTSVPVVVVTAWPSGWRVASCSCLSSWWASSS